MNKTGIGYLDYTWNPVHGCTHSGSPGCDNCWARAMAKRLAAMGKAGYDPADPFGVRWHSDRMEEPLRLKKPARIGVCFMGDLFHNSVPACVIGHVFYMTSLSPQHTFYLLTKRPGRASDLMDPENWQDERSPMPNVLLGTSISTQQDADEKIPELLRYRAEKRWLSIEPLLEPIVLRPRPGIDAVVVGCESGPRRRRCRRYWIESLVDECEALGVPCYVKQMEIEGRVVSDPSHPQWPKWAKQERF